MLKRLFYVIATILIIIWAVGFFVYAVGALIHLLLILAVLLIAFKISRGSDKTKKTQKPVSKYREF